MKEKKPKVLDVTTVKEKPQMVVAQKDQSVESLISQAISQNLPVETLERLFSLRERVKAEQAKETFIKSMSVLQSELPVIKKLKDGHVAKFAPLEDVMETTKPFIKKHGFSYRWNTSQTDKSIKVVCIATHELGHSEQTEMISEVEETVTGKDSGKATKSAPQRVASTITFLKRYTFVNLFGVVIAGEDFDGRMEKQNTGKVLPPSGAMSDKAKIIHLLKMLTEKVGTKEEIGQAVERLTDLELEEGNFAEIVTRLELLVKEKREYESSQV
jgi:hypothetical protein